MSRLEITEKSGVSRDGAVRLDGLDISNALRGLRLNMEVGELTVAELDVVAIELSGVDVEVKAHIPDETRDLLIRLGWTPPEAT